jgi:hypothetical protein
MPLGDKFINPKTKFLHPSWGCSPPQTTAPESFAPPGAKSGIKPFASLTFYSVSLASQPPSADGFCRQFVQAELPDLAGPDLQGCSHFS